MRTSWFHQDFVGAGGSPVRNRNRGRQDGCLLLPLRNGLVSTDSNAGLLPQPAAVGEHASDGEAIDLTVQLGFRFPRQGPSLTDDVERQPVGNGAGVNDPSGWSGRRFRVLLSPDPKLGSQLHPERLPVEGGEGVIAKDADHHAIGLVAIDWRAQLLDRPLQGAALGFVDSCRQALGDFKSFCSRGRHRRFGDCGGAQSLAAFGAVSRSAQLRGKPRLTGRSITSRLSRCPNGWNCRRKDRKSVAVLVGFSKTCSAV